jgi:GMP synthase-like glutamine amidotransferase
MYRKNVVAIKLGPSFLGKVMKKLNILLIDNDTYYKQRLKRLLKNYQVTQIGHDEVATVDANTYDLIILSGGGISDDSGRRRSLLRFTHFYRDQIQLVRTTTRPVIGICLGCEIIGYAFGSKLSRPFKQRRKGIFSVAVLRRDPIMGGQREARVFQSNRWIITDVGDELEVIAASDEGAEIIRHRKRQVFGVQFHPERRQGDNDGAKIFANIIKEIQKHSSKPSARVVAENKN